jgi:hypothetical protein
MYHVTTQYQDSTVAEVSGADYDQAMQIYAAAINDPAVMTCNAFDASLGTWLYFHFIPPSIVSTDPAGFATSIELPALGPFAPIDEPFKVTIRDHEGIDFTGAVLAIHEAPEETVLWILTDDGTYTIAGASQILPELPADIRVVVDRISVGAKASRNAPRFEEVTAYLIEGEFTGPRIEVNATYPWPDYAQIMVAPDEAIVVHAAALEPAAQAPEPAPESIAGAGASPEGGPIDEEEEKRRQTVMTNREVLLAAMAAGDNEAEAKAFDEFKASIAALTMPWHVVDALKRDIDAREAAEKAIQGQDAEKVTDTPKTENKAPRAKKTGKAAK